MRERSAAEGVPPRDGFWLGLGKSDITVFEPGTSMWGWGSSRNVPTGATTPLHARALFLTEGERGRPYVFACLDLGMISESIRRAVLAELSRRGVDVDEHRLTLTATHTHSGPSGFSTYLFYALSGPGFSHRVHDHIVRGTVEAILAARTARGPGRVRVAADDIPLTEPVSFQRALAAYNRNTDVVPVPADRADEAVHRRMTVLRFEDREGLPRGLLSFFPVHGTSVHADATALHGDNKGLAASACERDPSLPPGFIAIFAQESAGDVSPNYRPAPSRGVMVGRYDDDHASAEHNASIQARHALRLCRAAAREGRELRPPLTARLRYAPLHEVVLDPDLADGVEGRRTGDATVGLGFALGTAEGPGPLRAVAGAAMRATRLLTLRSARADDVYRSVHGRKVPFWDLGVGARNRIGGWLAADHPVVSLGRDRRVRYYREAIGLRGAHILPWIPHHLPVQLVAIGDLALAFLPAEPTTQCGRRLRALMCRELADTRDAVLVGYSNAYAGYVTTPEEYDEQGYEGSMTMFGRWSLGAFATELRRVARAMRASEPEDDIGEPPPTVPLEQWIPVVGERLPSASDEPARAAGPRSLATASHPELR